MMKGHGRGLRNSALLGLLVGMLVGSGSVVAFAATSYSNWSYPGVSGVTYADRAYITDSSGGIGGLHLKRNDGASSPSGYLGGTVELYFGTSTLCRTVGPTYNSGSIVQLVVQASVPAICGFGMYYHTGGTVHIYNPSTGAYVSSAILNSPNLWIP